MAILAPEEESYSDEPFFGEDEYPSETEEISTSAEDSESEVVESDEAPDGVEASAEAEQEGESEIAVDETQREIQLLKDQLNFMMEREKAPAPDIAKLQQEVSVPFRFELPSNLDSVEGVSEEFKQIAKDDPATIQVMGEMMNILLNQYGAHAEKANQANQTIQAYQQEQYTVLERELGAVGIDPKFADSQECMTMLEDQAYLQRAQSYNTLYGMSSPRFYTNLYADFVEWAGKNNVKIAQGKKQAAAQRSASAPKRPSGANSAPQGSKTQDDDFYAQVANYQKRS